MDYPTIELNETVGKLLRTILHDTLYNRQSIPSDYTIMAEYDLAEDKLTVQILGYASAEIIAEVVL